MSSSAFSNQNGLFCPWPKTLATRVELCRRGPLHDASYSRTMEYDDVPFGKRRSSSFESTKFQPKFWYNSIQVIFENYHHVLSCIWVKIFLSLNQRKKWLWPCGILQMKRVNIKGIFLKSPGNDATSDGNWKDFLV